MILLTSISVQVVPSIAIAFVTYEQVKDILGVEMRYRTDDAGNTGVCSTDAVFLQTRGKRGRERER